MYTQAAKFYLFRGRSIFFLKVSHINWVALHIQSHCYCSVSNWLINSFNSEICLFVSVYKLMQKSLSGQSLYSRWTLFTCCFLIIHGQITNIWTGENRRNWEMRKIMLNFDNDCHETVGILHSHVFCWPYNLKFSCFKNFKLMSSCSKMSF